MLARFARSIARLGLSLLVLVALLLALAPSASATEPTTCVSNVPGSETNSFSFVRVAGPNAFWTDHNMFVLSPTDPCASGTLETHFGRVSFADGDFQQHGFGTFTGAIMDKGTPRTGTIRYQVSVHAVAGSGGLAVVDHLTFLSGTGTGGLAGLHGVVVLTIDTRVPSYTAVALYHWDS